MTKSTLKNGFHPSLVTFPRGCLTCETLFNSFSLWRQQLPVLWGQNESKHEVMEVFIHVGWVFLSLEGLRFDHELVAGRSAVTSSLLLLFYYCCYCYFMKEGEWEWIRNLGKLLLLPEY